MTLWTHKVWCYHRLWPSTDFLFDTPLLVMAIASITELPYHFELAVPSLPAWHRAHSCHQSDTSGDTKSDVQRTKSPPLHQRWSTAASKRTSTRYPSPHAPVEKKQRIHKNMTTRIQLLSTYYLMDYEVDPGRGMCTIYNSQRRWSGGSDSIFRVYNKYTKHKHHL